MSSYKPTTAEMVCAYAHQYEWKISFVRHSCKRFYWCKIVRTNKHGMYFQRYLCLYWRHRWHDGDVL